MNKKLIAGIIIVIVIALAYFLFFRSPASAPAPETGGYTTGDDTTGAISQDLESLDMGDLDKEFEAIDADLQSL